MASSEKDLEQKMLEGCVPLSCGCVYAAFMRFPLVEGHPQLAWRRLGTRLTCCFDCRDTTAREVLLGLRGQFSRGPHVARWVDADGQRVPLGTFVRVFSEIVGEPPPAEKGYIVERFITGGIERLIRRNGQLVSWTSLSMSHYARADATAQDPWEAMPGLVVTFSARVNDLGPVGAV